MLKALILSLVLLSSCSFALHVKLLVSPWNLAKGALQFYFNDTTELSVEAMRTEQSEILPDCLKLKLKGLQEFEFKHVAELQRVGEKYKTTTVKFPDSTNMSEQILVTITECQNHKILQKITAKVIDIDFTEAF